MDSITVCVSNVFLYSSGGVLVFSSNGRLLTQLIDRVSPGDVGTLSPLSDLTFLPSPNTNDETHVYVPVNVSLVK